MNSTISVDTSVVMVVVFAVITVLFAIAITAFVNPKFRERVLGFLPFSKQGNKQPPLPIIILIIVGAMVIAYFF